MLLINSEVCGQAALDLAAGPFNEIVPCERGDKCLYGADRFLTFNPMKLIVSWGKKRDGSLTQSVKMIPIITNKSEPKYCIKKFALKEKLHASLICIPYLDH